MPAKNTKLAHLILSKGFSVTEIARGTGIDKSLLSLIKNGHQNMTIGTLRKICVFLDCSPNEVLDWEAWK